MILFILAVVWVVIGWASFTYWWTREHDLSASDLPLLFIAGILGPGAFILGYIIHGDDKVLIKQRNRK